MQPETHGRSLGRRAEQVGIVDLIRKCQSTNWPAGHVTLAFQSSPEALSHLTGALAISQISHPPQGAFSTCTITETLAPFFQRPGSPSPQVVMLLGPAASIPAETLEPGWTGPGSRNRHTTADRTKDLWGKATQPTPTLT